MAGWGSDGVGDAGRLPTVFLQLLEQDASDSLLVATTNRPNLLDEALFRRFEAVVHYPLPTAPVARAVIGNRLAVFRLQDLAWDRVDEATAGLSHADITIAAERAARAAILCGQEDVDSGMLVSALRDRPRWVGGGCSAAGSRGAADHRSADSGA